MTQEPAASFELDDISVLAFLEANPDFFNRHPTLLMTMQLPDPHGEGVIAISTKQIELLRAKLDEKRDLLASLIKFGNTNDQIQGQIHALSLALFNVTDNESLTNLLDSHIKEAFGLSHASLHTLADNPALPEQFTNWLMAQSAPYCSNATNTAISALFDSDILDHTHGSFSVIPMFDENSEMPVNACLILAAKDPQHFTHDMETDFLTRIGELIYKRFVTLDENLT